MIKGDVMSSSVFVLALHFPSRDNRSRQDYGLKSFNNLIKLGNDSEQHMPINRSKLQICVQLFDAE